MRVPGADWVVDEAAIAEMVAVLRDGIRDMAELVKMVDQVVATVEGDALLGKGGDSFAHLLRNSARAKIGTLAQDFEKQIKFLDKEVDDYKDAVRSVNKGLRGG